MDSAPLIFLPEHQRQASNELNQSIARAMQKVIDDQGKNPALTAQQRLHELNNVINEAIREWLKKYPLLTKLSIGFDLKFDTRQGKVTMIPSFDLQRLMGGLVTI